MWILTLISTLVSTVFSGFVLRQYRQKGKPYQLVWGIALAFFAIATASELSARLIGWTPLLIRTYYLFGATLVVGYLALGTLYLMANPKIARIAAGLLVTLSALAAVSVMGAPIAQDALHEGYRAMDRPVMLRTIAIFLNSFGTLVVVGGALWSAVTFLRTKAMPRRALAMGLIAAGVLITAAGGTLTGQLGYPPEAITVANTIGVTIMFAGVLQADRRPAVESKRRVES